MKLSSYKLLRCAYEPPEDWKRDKLRLTPNQQEAIGILRKTISSKTLGIEPLELDADVLIDFRAATLFSPFFKVAGNLMGATRPDGFLALFPTYLNKKVYGKDINFGSVTLTLKLKNGGHIKTWDDYVERPPFIQRLKNRLELRKIKKELVSLGLTNVKTILTYIGFGFVGQKKRRL